MLLWPRTHLMLSDGCKQILVTLCFSPGYVLAAALHQQHQYFTCCLAQTLHCYLHYSYPLHTLWSLLQVQFCLASSYSI